MSEASAFHDAAPTDPSSSSTEPPSRKRPRDGWVVLGLFVSALSAAVSSFSGLRSLAVVAGWSPLLAPLLPLCIDSLAMTALRVWVSAATKSARARRFAKQTALGAILLSVAGNAVYHVIAAGLLEVTWIVVLAVGAVPAVVLGLVSHLAVLRTQEDVPGSPPRPSRNQTVGAASPGTTGQGRDGPRPKGQSSKATRGRPRYGSQNDLLAAARAADAAHRAVHGGKGITRDKLRRSLRISGQRATEALRTLRQEAK